MSEPRAFHGEFHQAHIRAEWPDWTFAAHQAATQAAASEELTALRRQYTDLSEADLLRLAQSWRSDDTSGPYFTFTAADASSVGAHDAATAPSLITEPTLLAVDATFVRALLHELSDQAPSALTALLDHWTEQRRHATRAGLHRTPSPPPRVALLVPRDPTNSPPDAWPSLLALDLAAPTFDGAILRWDNDSALWQPVRSGPNLAGAAQD
jgi:hypothetical protein